MNCSKNGATTTTTTTNTNNTTNKNNKPEVEQNHLQNTTRALTRSYI